MPKVSVIVPVYKVEQYLHRCVDSILQQTFIDFDIILVDDGSPDDCGSICDYYALKDSRIHVIHQDNGGLSAARNTGIEWALANSQSEWITFIDSDDWIHPRYLEILYEAVQNTGLFVAVGGFERMKEEVAPAVLKDIHQKVYKPEEFYCTDKITATVAWGKLDHKQDFTLIRYPERKIHEDEFTTYKILFAYDKIAVVEQPLYSYFQNDKSIMGSKWNPKHIAEIEGMLAELQYFKTNGFLDAAACTATAYINSIYRNLMNAKSYGKLYQTETVTLNRKLKIALLKYRKLANVSLRKNHWLYYEAFHGFTLPYRVLLKLVNR